jgi:tRNA(Arg) A34 adenosine deaminase TadA
VKIRTIKKSIDIAHALCPTNWQNVNNSHIAFLVKKNKIVKIGWNRKRTHPKIAKHPYHDGYVGTHAELDVILKSGLDNLDDHSMIVLRVDRKGRLANSKPCPGCLSLIKSYNVNQVFYSDTEGNIEKLSNSP